MERRWWLWGLQSEISRLKIDLFHGTDFAVPYVPVRPSVLTLHDLSPWLDPAWHTAAERVRKRTPVLLRLGLATLLLTPSEAIRREAIARFRLSVDRIVSVPHAASAVFRPVLAPQPETPFFLFVGTLEPRKNVGMLVDAWREVRARHSVSIWFLPAGVATTFPNYVPNQGCTFSAQLRTTCCRSSTPPAPFACILPFTKDSDCRFSKRCSVARP